MLRLAVTPCRGGAGFDLRRFAPLATLVRGERGREHLLLADARSTLRVDIIRGTLLDGPVEFTPRFSRMCNLGLELGALRRFLRLWRTGRLPRPRPSLPVEERAAAALLVHDARAAGATLRDLAVLLYGAQRAAEWPGEGDSMKSAVRRFVALAERLANDPWQLLP